MSTIFSKDNHNYKEHYSLRKFGTGLASVLISVNVFGLVAKPNKKVEADILTDESLTQEKGLNKDNREFAIFGKIIPVNKKREIIKNTRAVTYQRDPQNPNKALPTPPPKIQGYVVSKKNQVKNYDADNNLVIPPVNPRQNTYLTYQKNNSVHKNSSSKLSVKHENGINPNTQKKKSSEWDNKSSSVVSNQNEQETNEKVLRKTRFFGFGKNKKREDSVKKIDNKDIDQDSSNLNEDEKEQHSKDQKSVIRQNSKDNDQQKTKKHKKQKKNQLKQDEKPQAILNKKTKLPLKPLLATVRIVDNENDDKVLTEFEVKGYQNEPIKFDNIKQVIEIYIYDGYELKNIINEDNNKQIKSDDLDHLEFGNFKDDDIQFKVALDHKKILLTAENAIGKLDLKQLLFKTSLTIHYTGAGDQTPKDVVENAVWNRHLTYDLVTKQVVKGKFDTDWKPTPKFYPKVVSPKLAGYTADIKEVSPVLVQKDSLVKEITYVADQQKITPPPVLKDKKEEEEKQKAVTASDYEKTVKFTVKYIGAGDKQLAPNVQTAKWERSLKINEDGKLVNGSWKKSQDRFDDVRIPVVPGYHTDRAVVSGAEVTQKDIEKTVEYHQNGYFIPVDQAGQPLGNNKQYQTDPLDSSQVLKQEKLPKISGYQAPVDKMDPYNPDKNQQVFYQKLKRNILVNTNHPNQLVSANEYRKLVHFKVEFSGAGSNTPKAIDQTIELTRNLTVDDSGNIITDGIYTTPWQAKSASFKDVEIPEIPGYKAEQKKIIAPENSAKDVVKHVKYLAISSDNKAKSDSRNLVQKIHFVDQFDHKLVPDQINRFSEADIKNNKTINVAAPVIEGYFVKENKKEVKASASEITVKYLPLGRIIPIDLDGELIQSEEDKKQSFTEKFKNDPKDPSCALADQPVPKIAGWQSSVPTVSPINPGIDIPVLYKRID